MADVTLQTQSLLKPSAQTVTVHIGHATLALTWLDKGSISTETDPALLDKLRLPYCHYLSLLILVCLLAIILYVVGLLNCPWLSVLIGLSVHVSECDVLLCLDVLSECLLSELIILHSFNCLIIYWTTNDLSLCINLSLRDSLFLTQLIKYKLLVHVRIHYLLPCHLLHLSWGILMLRQYCHYATLVNLVWNLLVIAVGSAWVSLLTALLLIKFMKS